MIVCVNDVVVPGDVVGGITGLDDKSRVILGPGLRRCAEQVIVCKSGLLKKINQTFYVDSHQKRYIPVRGEAVVGIVSSKAGDFFKVDIGGSEQASLHYLAFEGATKKNRPNLNVGDTLYATVLSASKDMEPELVCIDSTGKKGKMGVIDPDGFLFICSLNLIRKILNPKCLLLKYLGKEVAYEIAIGMNGKVWVKAKNVKTTIAIASAVLAAEHAPYDEIVSNTNDILNKLLL
ncbi:exosome complex component RRP40-like [Macrosteles quadrilineatus]|uniref:exosome complex component RRP40-like n=1 Tax=Macrosteles quadrilineatus TaxID=74068 RepID=UPI0023E24150|nr:exosome complex component RRP40-like [Macrosteles quadrilineatus]